MAPSTTRSMSPARSRAATDAGPASACSNPAALALPGAGRDVPRGARSDGTIVEAAPAPRIHGQRAFGRARATAGWPRRTDERRPWNRRGVTSGASSLPRTAGDRSASSVVGRGGDPRPMPTRPSRPAAGARSAAGRARLRAKSASGPSGLVPACRPGSAGRAAAALGQGRIRSRSCGSGRRCQN